MQQKTYSPSSVQDQQANFRNQLIELQPSVIFSSHPGNTD
jgi:hypothetical protein